MSGLQHDGIMTGHFTLKYQREKAKCEKSTEVILASINSLCVPDRSDSSPDLQLVDFSRWLLESYFDLFISFMPFFMLFTRVYAKMQKWNNLSCLCTGYRTCLNSSSIIVKINILFLFFFFVFSTLIHWASQTVIKETRKQWASTTPRS